MLNPHAQRSQLIPGPAGRLEVILEKPHPPLSTPQTELEPSNTASETPPLGVFVCCHPHPLMQGTMHNKVVTTACKAFLEKNYVTVRFNYRGVGQSEGSYGHMTGECQDLIAVTDWARQQFPNLPLILGGFSFGSYIAYASANALNASRLILIAPAVRFQEETSRYHTTPEPVMPWYVLIPEADEVVSSADTHRWLTTVTSNPQVVSFPGVSHFFHGKLLDLKQALLSV